MLIVYGTFSDDEGLRTLSGLLANVFALRELTKQVVDDLTILNTPMHMQEYMEFTLGGDDQRLAVERGPDGVGNYWLVYAGSDNDIVDALEQAFAESDQLPTVRMRFRRPFPN